MAALLRRMPEAEPGRRRFLRVAQGALLAAPAAITGIGVAVERIRFRLREVEVEIPSLPLGLEGLRLVQLSDIHLEPYTQPPLVQKAVVLINQLKPDVAVLSGDYVWRWADSAFSLTPILAGINARHGIYATMGNHDYWTDIRVVQAAFDHAHIPVLYNQGVALPFNGETVYLLAARRRRAAA